jgi:hypothetical protein
LVNLSRRTPATLDQFARVIEIISSDEDDAAAGRKRYSRIQAASLSTYPLCHRKIMSQASFDAASLSDGSNESGRLGDDLLPGEAAPPRRAELAAQLEEDAIDGWTDAEWEAMEHRLSAASCSLQSRVDFVLEQRIKDSMAEVLSHALRDLTNEVRIGLHDTIEKIVARAVTQELTHCKRRRSKPLH